jgi:4-amino-4-deoxy-L-arabinose transferase-like glycosyltransferase
MSLLQKHKKLVLGFFITILLLFSGIILFYKLGHEAFQDYDEATYAEITSESLAHGNVFSLTLLNSPYFRKPPLLFWLTDASNEVIKNPEVADRLPSALSALLLIELVMLVCYEAGGGYAAALISGAILATTSAFIEPARQVRFDILVSLFIIATFYAVLRAKKNPTWYLAAGIFLGLAFLSKDVISVFAVIAGVSYLFLDQRFAFFRNKYFWWGIGLFFVVVLPWHLYETFKYGAAFWQSYIGTEVFSRVTTNIFGSGFGPTNLDYDDYFFTFAAPWAQFLIASLLAFPFFYKKMNRNVRNVILASGISLLAIIAVLLISHTKALSYLIPAYPFIAIIVALTISELYRLNRLVVRALLALALLIAIPFGMYFTVTNALHINSYYAYEVEYSFEEEQIGLTLRALTSSPVVYTYNDDDYGTIEYYSTLPFTKNPYVLLLSSESKVVGNSYVFSASSRSELASAFPSYTFIPIYTGADVSLFAIKL